MTEPESLDLTLEEWKDLLDAEDRFEYYDTHMGLTYVQHNGKLRPKDPTERVEYRTLLNWMHDNAKYNEKLKERGWWLRDLSDALELNQVPYYWTCALVVAFLSIAKRCGGKVWVHH